MFFVYLGDDLSHQCMEYKTGINTVAIVASVNKQHRDCRECLIPKIFDKIKGKALEEDWSVDDYLGKKKELVSALKDFDKLYNNHIKTAHSDILEFQNDCFTHLKALLQSNWDFYNIKRMIDQCVD